MPVHVFLYLRLNKRNTMTKIFVPVFAACLLTVGTLNAQTPKGKPAPAVKKVTVPVRKVPVPVGRPVVPVTKPSAASKPAAPVVAKPAPAPKPVATKPAAAPKPVAAPKPAHTPAPAKKAPVAVKKAPVTHAPAKKAVVNHKKATPKKKIAPASQKLATPAPRTSPKRYTEDAMPAPKRVIEERIVIREESNDAPSSCNSHKKSSCCDKHDNESPKSINGCGCYSHMPHACKPWKFRYRRYYRYNYTMQHYNACKEHGCNGHHH